MKKYTVLYKLDNVSRTNRHKWRIHLINDFVLKSVMLPFSFARSQNQLALKCYN